ncbi:MAG: DUF1572 family protein [Ferruginibacter sp.]
MTLEENYLTFSKKQFAQYKLLAEKAIDQIDGEKLFIQANKESNSIAMIVQHMAGNMVSRWTDFLTTDGEKNWRKRDEEFELILKTKEDVMQAWENGWQCLFTALDNLTPSLLLQTIFIRAEAHTVLQAINRQLAHYPYHVGQIIFIAKMFNDQFETLSMPRKK